MKKYTKLYHSTIEVIEDETRYFLVLTEICVLTNRVIGTYSVRLADWVADNENQQYRYYQPIFN